MKTGFLGMVLAAGIGAYIILIIKNRAEAENDLKSSFNWSKLVVNSIDKRIEAFSKGIILLEQKIDDLTLTTSKEKREKKQLQKQIAYLKNNIAELEKFKTEYLKLHRSYESTNGRMNTSTAHHQLLAWVKNRHNVMLLKEILYNFKFEEGTIKKD